MKDQTDFSPGNLFGIPDIEDPDPYGVKALEAEGLNIREAGTHSRPSAEVFEFNPSPSSPIYPAYRRSVDSPLRGRTNSWRGSVNSIASIDRGTQTADGSANHSPEKKNGSSRPSPTLQEIEPVADSDESDTPYDADEHAEIETAVPVVTRARVVSVQKKGPPPSLPPRNPIRVSALSPTNDVNDGFDSVSLNGSEHIIEAPSSDHHAQETDAPKHEESQHSIEVSTHGADDDFHSINDSIPTTPAEKKDGIPGSFE